MIYTCSLGQVISTSSIYIRHSEFVFIFWIFRVQSLFFVFLFLFLFFKIFWISSWLKICDSTFRILSDFKSRDNLNVEYRISSWQNMGKFWMSNSVSQARDSKYENENNLNVVYRPRSRFKSECVCEKKSKQASDVVSRASSTFKCECRM